MRISVDKEDRAFSETMSYRVDSVTLDGKLVAMAITADEEEGFVRYFGVNPDGSPQLDPKDPSRLMVYEATGKVVIKMKKKKWDEERRKAVKVKVGRDPNTHSIILLVYSAAREGAIREVNIKPSDVEGKSMAEICQFVGICAGAQMENMAERFGDKTDPSLVASVAVEQAYQMLTEEEKNR